MVRHDVVVVGAGLAGMRAAIEASRYGADVGVVSKLHPTRSHSGRRRGRHQRRAWQCRRGQPRAAHLLHRQGLRLPGRPGRDRGDVRRRPGRHLRAGAHGRGVLAHGGRQDRPAAVRRGRRAAHLLRRRHHRPRAAARALRAAGEERRDRLRGVVRPRPGHRRRALRRPDCLGSDAWRRPGRRGRRGHPGNRRPRPHLPRDDQRVRLHRRRHVDGLAGRGAAEGHGVHPVPPDDAEVKRGADHRGRPRRGRLPAERGTATASCTTTRRMRASWPRATSSRAPSRPRSTTAAASTAASCSTSRTWARSGSWSGCTAPASWRWTTPASTRSRSRSRCGRARTTTWAESTPTSGAAPRCPGSTPPARRPACRCTAPTGWVATRCSRPWCSAAGRAWPPHRTCDRTARAVSSRPAAVRVAERRIKGLLDVESGERPAVLRRELADMMYDNAGHLPHRREARRVQGRGHRAARAATTAAIVDSGQGPHVQQRPRPGHRAGRHARDGRLPGHRRGRPRTRAAAPTAASTSPSATTRTGCATPSPTTTTARCGSTTSPSPSPSTSRRFAPTEETPGIHDQDRALQPRDRGLAHRAVHGRRAGDGDPARRAGRDQGRRRRLADLPQVVPDGRLRLLRHAHGRRGRARLQDADGAASPRAGRSLSSRRWATSRWSRTWSSTWRRSGRSSARSSPTWTTPTAEVPVKEWRVQQEELDRIMKEALCIQCGCCVSECNSMQADPDFLGPGGARQGGAVRLRRPRPRRQGPARALLTARTASGTAPAATSARSAAPRASIRATRSQRSGRRSTTHGMHVRQGRAPRQGVRQVDLSGRLPAGDRCWCPRRSARSRRSRRSRSR